MKEVIFSIGEVTLEVKDGDQDKTITYKPIANPNYLGREKIAIPFFKPKIPVVVYPLPNSPAKKAGLKNGDKIVELNGKVVNSVEQFHFDVLQCDGKDLNLVVKRKLNKGDDFERIKLVVKPVLATSEPIYKIGIQLKLDNSKRIEKVIPNTPAEKAQLLAGDLIESVNGEKVNKSGDIFKIINNKENRDKELTFKIKRDDNLVEKKILPAKSYLYKIGVQFAFTNYPNPWQQFTDVIDMTYKSIRGIAYGFMKKSTLKPSNMSGPIGIIHVIGRAVYSGSYMRGLYIIVVITFSLAIFNLLPLPVLDGGHIVIALIEIIVRRPLSPKIIQPITMAFVALLIGMMVYVTYNDVLRMIPQKKTVPVTKTVQDKITVPVTKKIQNKTIAPVTKKVQAKPTGDISKPTTPTDK